VIVTVWTTVRLVRKQPAAWVTLLGLGTATVIYVAANIMLFTGVSRSSASTEVAPIAGARPSMPSGTWHR
jgi:uncharacterized membrane protein